MPKINPNTTRPGPSRGLGYISLHGYGRSFSLSIKQIIDVALRGELTDELAAAALGLGPEAVLALMFAASARIAELQRMQATPPPGPHTPSGTVPAYAKLSISKRRRGKPQARVGHKGHRRPAPRRIDRHVDIESLKTCPDCGTPIGPAKQTRRRVIEDNHASCYYIIDRSRGSPALKRFLAEAFRGVLIHDFWRPYGSVLLEGAGDHQCCLAHLLRELDNVDERALPPPVADG